MGVVFTAIGEYADVSFDWIGFTLTLFGVVMASLKGIVSYCLMTGSLKLHPLDLLRRIALLCVLQCFIYAWIFNEWEGFAQYLNKYPITQFWSNQSQEKMTSYLYFYIQIIYNGILAFLLNWISFTANKKTSALSMTIAANVKQAFAVLLAIYIFSTPISLINVLGICITLIGGAWYR